MELSNVTSKTIEKDLVLLANLTRTDATTKGLPTYGSFNDDTPYLAEYKENEKDTPFVFRKKKGDYCGHYFKDEKTFLYHFRESETSFHKADLRIEEAAKNESSTIGISKEPWILSLPPSIQLDAYLQYRLMELGLPQSYFQRKAKWLFKSYEIIRIGASEDERSYLSHETAIHYLFLIMRQGDIRGLGPFQRTTGLYSPIPSAKTPRQHFEHWMKQKKSRNNRKGGNASARKREP